MDQLNLLSDLVDDIVPNAGKCCSKCGTFLPLSAYSAASGGNYLRSECKKCRQKMDRVRQKLRKEFPPPANDHCCPICRRNAEQTEGHGGKQHKTPWVLDHDHFTDEARGWLCHTCNRGLGAFNDDVDILGRAILYLNQFSEPVNDNEKAHETDNNL